MFEEKYDEVVGYTLCKINLAIILYGPVNPHRILHFIF